MQSIRTSALRPVTHILGYAAAGLVAAIALSAAGSLFVSSHASAIACPTDSGVPVGGGGVYGADRGGRLHAGIDVGVDFRPIYAAHSGEVRTQWYDGYQITKDLHGDDGRVYRYAHLAEGGVDGRVNGGSAIGTSGDGQGAYAPHLHWEIRTDGGGFGYTGTVNPTGEYNSACLGGGSNPGPVGSNPGSVSNPPVSMPPAVQPPINAPSVTPACSGNVPVASVSWGNAGLSGIQSYTVDVDNDDFKGGWWNKNVGTSTNTSIPGGFIFYPSGGDILSLNSGWKYYVRIFYGGPDRHSETKSFVASDCSTPPPPPPQASPSSSSSGSGQRIVSMASGRCLDVRNHGTGNGSEAQIWDCSGGSNQSWSLYGNGEIRIYGNKCLDVRDFGTSNGSRVQIWDCSGGSNQQWRF